MPVLLSPFALYQHATTTKKLIKAALRKIGALGAGEELEAGEFQDALDELNRMLDSWNTERLVVNALNKNEWALLAATASIEIGPGANLDQARPSKIEEGDVFIRKSGTVAETPLKVWSQERFASISDKTTTGQPQLIYYEAQFPIGVIHFWPVLDQGYDFIIYTWNLLSQVSNVEQSLALLPAYADAIVHGLAIRLAPEYGKQVPPEVVAAFLESRANLKRINQPSADAQVDEALLDLGRYDINTDGFGYGGD